MVAGWPWDPEFDTVTLATSGTLFGPSYAAVFKLNYLVASARIIFLCLGVDYEPRLKK